MWKHDVRILLVAAKSSAAREICHVLSLEQVSSKIAVGFETDHVSSWQTAAEKLQSGSYDIVIADLRASADEQCKHLADLRKDASGIPILALLDNATEKNILSAESAGADECLESCAFSLIPQAVRFLAGRRRAERHCLRIEEEFKTLIQHSADITILMDQSSQIRYISPSVEHVLGYKPAELHGLSGFDFVHPDDLTSSQQKLAETLAQPTKRVISEFRFRHKNGRWTPLEIACGVSPNKNGELQIICNARDISTRWRAEESSRQSEEQFRTIFENSPDAMFVEDLNGRVLDVNAAACWLHGLPREKIIGKTVLELVPPGEHEAVLRDFPKIVAGQIKKLEGESLTTDGRVIPIELTVSRILYAGEPAMLLNVRDISERRNAENAKKKLEEDLRQMQKLDCITHLAASLAHDFNNIIAVVQGHAGLLLNEPSLPPGAHESAHQISQAAERAGKLTRQLLSFSRKQAIQINHVDLNEIVRDFSKMLARVLGENITLDCQPAAQPAFVLADRGMVEQILLNLIINARDAIGVGGRVTIQIRPALPDDSALIPTTSSELQPDYFCLSVTDTGVGIAPENLPRIFEPFFTTKAKTDSTGLGLATVYGIVKQHNGWVDVQSNPGQGSTFKVYLPVGRTPVSATPNKDSQQTILVLETDPDIRQSASTMLREEGFRVLEANSNIQALEYSHLQSPKTDLIITNPDLYESSNGHDVIQGFKAGNPDLKVILITGNTKSKHTTGNGNRHSYPLNTGYLEKPFDTDKLCHAVRETLQTK